jgi:FkbM family methyltransferase
MPSPLLLRVLRTIPPFKGKSRIARRLLSNAQRNRPTVLRDCYGNQMVVPNLIEPIGFALGINGCYEPEMVDVLRRNLTPSTDFVDVGANIGSLTVALAGFARKVFAIEASPAVLPFLRRNVEMGRHNNIEVIGCAVAAPDVVSVPFYVPPMDHFGMGSSAGQFGAEPIKIRAQSLDRLLAGDNGARIGAIKVDVEGFEADVFAGAAEILARDAPLVAFEFCDWAEERAFPGQRGRAQRIMLDAGYALWSLPEYLDKSAPLSNPLTEGFHTIVAERIPPL